MHEFFPMFVTQVWQVTLLAAVVWIVTKTLCKRRPHLGHALWLLVLIKCVVPPVFSSSTSLYSWMLTDGKAWVTDDRMVEAEVPTAVANPPIVASNPMMPMKPTATRSTARPTQFKPVRPTSSITNSTPKVAVARKPASTIYQPVVPKPQTPTKTFRPQQRTAVTAPPAYRPSIRAASPVVGMQPVNMWHSWIVRIWLNGAALFLVVTLFRYLRFRSWIRRQESVEASDIEAQVQDLAKQLKLRRKIRVNVVDAEFGPAVIGLFRPSIVLPNSIVADQTAEQLEPILGHELLHLRRGDIYWSVLQVVACSLMWFHPLVWLASRNVTRESEKCCDEETIANFQCDRANYARVLVDILEQKNRLRIAPVVPGVRPADITSSRLERIMQSDNGTCRRTPRWIWALVVLIGVTVLPGAAVVQSQQEKVADSPKVQNLRSGFAQESVATKPSQFRQSPTPNVTSPKPAERARQAFSAPGRTVGPLPSATQLKSRQPAGFGSSLLPTIKQERVPGSRTFGGAFIKPVPLEARIIKLVTDDSERKKVSKELEDPIWDTEEARGQLANLKTDSVDVEVRFWIDRMELADEFLEEAAFNASSKFPQWRFAEQQISLAAYEKLSNHIADRQDQPFTLPMVKSYYPKSNADKFVAAQLFSPVVVGLNRISILDPESANTKKLLRPERAIVSGRIKMTGEDSISFNGQLTINKLKASSGRKLPLKFANREIRIGESATNNALLDFAWDIPKDRVQVVRAEFDGLPEKQMIVFVKTTRRSAKLPKDQAFTLSILNSIKKALPPAPNKDSLISRIELPTEPESFVDVRVPTQNPEETKVEPTSISLSLQCGDTESIEGRSISTKIGLASNSTLTIDGEVDSQQISADSVQVNGKNFVFMNEASKFRRHEVDADGVATSTFDSEKARKAGLFNAQADNGSISFKRGRPIEDTMRLSLRSKAVLQFAGIEFQANSIECFPDRIEARCGTDRVKVSIPEIASTVSADSVVLNLSELAFDFDGNVKVERNIEGESFPFMVNSNHVAWSLVTGQMDTNTRYSSRVGSTPSGFGSLGGGATGVNRFGSQSQVQFQPGAVRTQSNFTAPASRSVLERVPSVPSILSPIRN